MELLYIAETCNPYRETASRRTINHNFKTHFHSHRPITIVIVVCYV